jgi:hypothetical protein
VAVGFQIGGTVVNKFMFGLAKGSILRSHQKILVSVATKGPRMDLTLSALWTFGD